MTDQGQPMIPRKIDSMGELSRELIQSVLNRGQRGLVMYVSNLSMCFQNNVLTGPEAEMTVTIKARPIGLNGGAK